MITIPDLEIYIVDVWPSLHDCPLPLDLDGVRDRKNDLTYQTRHLNDEKVANIVSDYYELTSLLINLAKKKGATKEVDAILEKHAKSSHRNGEQRTYSDPVTKRFDITKIVRIERSVDKHDIANKWCDFSLETITNLFNQGRSDVSITLRSQDSRFLMSFIHRFCQHFVFVLLSFLLAILDILRRNPFNSLFSLCRTHCYYYILCHYNPVF